MVISSCSEFWKCRKYEVGINQAAIHLRKLNLAVLYTSKHWLPVPLPSSRHFVQSEIPLVRRNDVYHLITCFPPTFLLAHVIVQCQGAFGNCFCFATPSKSVILKMVRKLETKWMKPADSVLRSSAWNDRYHWYHGAWREAAASGYAYKGSM
jgi:hypothetical protein